MHTFDTSDLTNEELMELYSTLRPTLRSLSEKPRLRLWKLLFDITVELEEREDKLALKIS